MNLDVSDDKDTYLCCKMISTQLRRPNLRLDSSFTQGRSCVLIFGLILSLWRQRWHS